jgi:hypothetical protein
MGHAEVEADEEGEGMKEPDMSYAVSEEILTSAAFLGDFFIGDRDQPDGGVSVEATGRNEVVIKTRVFASWLARDSAHFLCLDSTAAALLAGQLLAAARRAQER